MIAAFLRPWHVLGPGHRWPHLLVPAYWLFERLPATREAVKRLGLVTLFQMVATLVAAVENPPRGLRIVEVPRSEGGTRDERGTPGVAAGKLYDLDRSLEARP